MTAVRRRPRRHDDGWFDQPSRLAAGFDPSALVGHFVIGRGEQHAPAYWASHTLAGWTLRSEPSLPVIELADAAGTSTGWLLGHPIDIEARVILHGSARIDRRADDPGFARAVERWLVTLGGRFAAVIVQPLGRAYVDPFGSLPLVFEPRTQRLASSPFLLADASGSVPDSTLVAAVAPYRSGRYYPLGATPHAHARLLLPSHALDLGTFEQSRVWPTGPLPTADPDTAVERVGDLLEATLEAASRADGAALALSGGGDSRMLLACARGFLDRLTVYTARFPDATGAADVRTARQIAAAVGVEHRTLAWVKPTDDDVRRWFYRTGALTGEPRGRMAIPTYAALGRIPVFLSGAGPEIARGRKWLRDDRTDTRLTAASLFERLGLASHPELLRLGEEWLAEVPGLHALDTIDLFFLEVCHGGWAGPVTLGLPEAWGTTIRPFAHREILELALGLPLAYRTDDGLRQEIVRRRWPELAAFRVNHVPLRYSTAERIARTAHMPTGALRRARRVVAARRTAAERRRRDSNPRGRDYPT